MTNVPKTGYGAVEVAAARRLPVFLLLDRSLSMTGPPIQAVSQGLQMFVQATSSDTMAQATVWVSVIQFGGTVEASSLCPLKSFQPPTLTPQGATPLGEALRKLNELVEQEVKMNSPEQKGDYKPFVWVLTDGAPTDEWAAPLAALQQRRDRRLNVIGIGCGPDADMDVIKKITPQAFRMEQMTNEAMLALFKWISSSVTSASHQLGAPGAAAGGGGEQQFTVPMPPNFLKFGA